MSEFITVKATKEDGKVVLWEVAPEHPTGEIFIAGDGATYEVALTPQIEAKLKDGSLVKASAAKQLASAPPVAAGNSPIFSGHSFTSEQPTDTQKVNRGRKGE